MFKKIVSIIVLGSFVLFQWSCTNYSYNDEKPDVISKDKDQEIFIASVLTKSKQVYEIAEGTKFHVQDEKLFVTSTDPYTLTIEKCDISSNTANISDSWHSRGVDKIMTKDGTVYHILDIDHEDDQQITFKTDRTPMAIPLSDIETVTIEKVDPIGSCILTLGCVALLGLAVYGAIMLIALLTKESCPFLYSYNGETYVFDAEPYGGAICEGMKRTEWCALENLKPVDGLYKIKLTNEVDETQYTDELKLVVVDHPKGTHVVPDEFGEMHTFRELTLSSCAVDEKGNDIGFCFTKVDRLYWQSGEDDLIPEDGGNNKKELFFTFPKPVDAAQVKIIFNGCNTLWASQMIKRYLELQGNQIHDYYAAINSKGPRHYFMKQWNLNEELYKLQVRVETSDGWKTKGILLGGGPFISEDRAYPIDISDVGGEILKIKLTPPKLFWMMDGFAIDYSKDVTTQIQEIPPIDAKDNDGKDVRNTVLDNDSTYLVMPQTGNWADLVFKAPEEKPDMDRTVFAKVTGYYDIHLNDQGEYKKEILSRFIEPGFSGRYAIQEYLNWINQYVKH